MNKKIIIGVVLTLLFAVLVAIPFSFGSIVKYGIKKYGPLVTKTYVSVSNVMLSPFTGSGKISGLVIGNPEGFDSSFAIKMRSLKIDLRPKTIFDDVVIIDTVYIKKPVISYEKNKGRKNLDVIERNVSGFSGSSSDKSKKFIIHNLLIDDPHLKVNSILTANKNVELDLPDIQMTNLGVDENGISYSVLASKIMKSLTRSAGNAVKSSGKQILNKGKAGTKKGKNKLKNLFK